MIVKGIVENVLITKHGYGTKELQLFVTNLIACGHAHQ